MMEIIMKYGKKGLSLNLPDNIEIDIIRKKEMPALENPADAIRASLFRPVDSRPLQYYINRNKSICILVCDITRPVPNGIILPVLIDEIIKSGAQPSSITMIVATGLHRPNEGEELRELIGNDRVMNTVKVVNHFARNDEDHVLVGTTSRGTPIKIDRRFVNADVRIVIGLVEPHFMAGYSGGRKLIIPGIAHQDTIKILHSAKVLNNPDVTNCVLEGNIFHEEQLEAVRMAGGSLALNTVIDEDRNISFVNFGGIVKSHLEAVSFARPYFEIPVNRRYKTVITSAAGYPLDRVYYQTVKGITPAADILEPGGDIFIVSECSGGLGSAEYIECQTRLTETGVDVFLEETSKKQYASVDEWCSVIQAKAMKKGTIHLFSEGLTKDEHALTGVDVTPSIEKSIHECLAKKNDKRIAVIPEGPYVIPLFKY